MKKVVSNTSPVSCLISLGRLDIFECKGTLWMLSQAKQKGLIPSLGEALHKLVHEYSFALDQDLIREACSRAGE